MKISKHQAVIVSTIVTVVLGSVVAYGVGAVQGHTDVEPEIGGPAEVTVESSPETVEPGVVAPQETQVEQTTQPQASVSTPQPKTTTVETPAPVVEAPVEQQQQQEVTSQPQVTYQGDFSTSSRQVTEFPNQTN